MTITSITRNFNGDPNIVTIVTDNSYAQITAPGYLNNLSIQNDISRLQNGVFQWNADDMILIRYDVAEGFFTRNSALNCFEPVGESTGYVTEKEVQQSAFNFQEATGINDAFIVNLNPSVTTLTDGLIVSMSSGILQNDTTTPTLQINSLSPVPITLWAGNPAPGDIESNSSYLFIYNQSQNTFQLLNPSITTADTFLVQSNFYNVAIDSGSADDYVINLTPDPNASIGLGFPVYMQVGAGNSNTGASQLTVNGQSAPIYLLDGSPLITGCLIENQLAFLVYSSNLSGWVLMNPSHGNGSFNQLTVNNLVINSEEYAGTTSYPEIYLTNVNKEGQIVTSSEEGDGIQFYLPDATTLDIGRTFIFTLANPYLYSGISVTNFSSTDFWSLFADSLSAGSPMSLTLRLVDNSTSDGIWVVNVGFNSQIIPVSSGGTGNNQFIAGNMVFSPAGGNSLSGVGYYPSALEFGGCVGWANNFMNFSVSTIRRQPFASSVGPGNAPEFAPYGLPIVTNANNLVYFYDAFTMASLATLNNGMLVTSAAGVPSISKTIPTGMVVTKVNGTEASNAMSFNGSAGVITTSSLSTAAGSSYAITWTNSIITATSNFSFCIQGGTNTINNILFKCVPGSGTATLTIYNNGSAPLNGTLLIGYSVY